MITRIWHGRTTVGNAPRYLDFLLDEGTNDYRNINGNVSARVWRRMGEDACDFWTVTEWRDIDSVKDFAGDDFQKAKYYPIDDSMLLEFEEHVQHYDSFDVSNSKIKSYMLQLEQLYGGGNWVGESFAGKLDSLPEDLAFQQPVPGVHSVAELVWHCIYWRRVTFDRLRGGKNKWRDETVEKFNFLPLQDLKAKGWNVIRDELMETQTELIELLKNKRDDFLLNEYQPGYSYDFLIGGTIQHDYYHLGQIGLVLRILKT
jgi:uncharacterized damage-inducible protein DinB/heme-degrading monooxygenase HmoA